MMKKILGALAAIMLVFCMAACGKSEENVVSETMGFDSIAFNGTTLTFPCKVQEVENALKGIKVKEEEVTEIVEPGQKYFGSIFDYNNTSFGTMNMSDSPVSVRECSVIMVSTTISLSEQTYDVVYPGGVEYGKKFDKEKTIDILGGPTYANETQDPYNYEFETTMENVGTYTLSVLVDTEGTVVGASLMMKPEVKAVAETETATETVAESEEPVETVETIEEPKAEIQAMDNLFDFVYRLQDIVYDESGLEKSEEELGFSLEDSKVSIKTKGVVISIPCNAQDFLNINSAIEWESSNAPEGWDLTTGTVQPGEHVTIGLPVLNSAVGVALFNPTDKELKATECVISSISVNATSARCNEIDSFELEFPGGIRIGEELDSEKALAEFGEYYGAESSDRMDYDWLGNDISFRVSVDKNTNLIDRVSVSYYHDDIEYVEPTIMEPTPYTSIAENMNIISVDVQSVADGTNEVITYNVGSNELQLPCTVQEIMDKTDLSLPEQFTYFTVTEGMYTENIPLFNEEGVKCLVLKVYNSNLEVSENVRNCTVIEIAQAENELIPEKDKLQPALADAEAETEAEDDVIEAEAAEGQIYYVKLLSHNEYKVAAIKVYRDYFESGLAEAKDVIDSVPCVILETMDLELAQEVAAAFEAEGCTIDEDMLSSEITE